MQQARLQQGLSLGLLALALLAWPEGLVGIVAVYAGVLGLEFGFMAWVNRDAGQPVGARAWLRAYWREFLCLRVFLWRQPWRSRQWADHLPPAVPGAPPRRGVVLVHGFFCNRGFWNPWLEQLRTEGVPFVAVNLEPIFGSIGEYPETIERAVRRVREASGGLAPVVVAHSMGGLAVRAWYAGRGAEAAHRVITLGSPHHGTWLGRFGHTTNGRQMRQRSPWLLDLVQREDPTRYTRFTCYWSECDNIVFPALTATLPGAENIALPGVPHVDMVHQEAPRLHLRQWLA